MSKLSGYTAINRANWDERADLHYADETGFYQVERLLAGESVLTQIETAELGPLDGLKVGHLQCHIGTDTLSLKRLGAASVVGLDFSSRSLEHARSLSARTGVEARFVEGIVYDAPLRMGTDFDLMFTSWGTIVWIDDLNRWADAIAGTLKPGGSFYYADCHPTAWMLANDKDGRIVFRYDYETPPDQPLPINVTINYSFAKQQLLNKRTYEWSHSMSSIVNALIGAGLDIDWLHEHEALQWKMLDQMTQFPDRLWRLPEGSVRIPLALSLRATKPL
ncbi:MAG TPA: class I SAM-dependent methyltransferase [Devosiaceae bacterium]|jgi:SAM-dependent methyltransferase